MLLLGEEQNGALTDAVSGLRQERTAPMFMTLCPSTPNPALPCRTGTLYARGPALHEEDRVACPHPGVLPGKLLSSSELIFLACKIKITVLYNVMVSRIKYDDS